MKTCSRCKTPKSEKLFYRDSSRRNGLDYTCKSCAGEKWKARRAKNPEYMSRYCRGWRKNNPGWWKKYCKTRRANDLSYRILTVLGNRVRIALIGSHKRSRATSLLGCSIVYAQTWLELQFKDGMSWENYGEWHIDHIRPCASFDLTCPAQQQQCFHYTNLQPLWAKDNLSKGAKWNLQPTA